MRTRLLEDDVEISTNGRTVWLNVPPGRCIARYGPTAVEIGDKSWRCLTWLQFCRLVSQNLRIDIPFDFKPERAS